MAPRGRGRAPEPRPRNPLERLLSAPSGALPIRSRCSLPPPAARCAAAAAQRQRGAPARPTRRAAAARYGRCGRNASSALSPRVSRRWCCAGPQSVGPRRCGSAQLHGRAHRGAGHRAARRVAGAQRAVRCAERALRRALRAWRCPTALPLALPVRSSSLAEPPGARWPRRAWWRRATQRGLGLAVPRSEAAPSACALSWQRTARATSAQQQPRRARRRRRRRSWLQRSWREQRCDALNWGARTRFCASLRDAHTLSCGADAFCAHRRPRLLTRLLRLRARPTRRVRRSAVRPRGATRSLLSSEQGRRSRHRRRRDADARRRARPPRRLRARCALLLRLLMTPHLLLLL
jgi:hypothetical protein